MRLFVRSTDRFLFRLLFTAEICSRMRYHKFDIQIGLLENDVKGIQGQREAESGVAQIAVIYWCLAGSDENPMTLSHLIPLQISFYRESLGILKSRSRPR